MQHRGVIVILLVGVAIAYGIYRLVPHANVSAIRRDAETSTPVSVEKISDPNSRGSAGGTAAMTSAPTGETSKALIANATLPSTPASKDLFTNMFSHSGAKGNAAPNAQEIMHEKFEAEPVDPNWSANVEPSIKDQFDNHPSSQTVDIVSIECRSTICEILAAAKSPAQSQQASEQVQETIYTSPRQSWWTAYGLVDVVTAMTLGDDGRMLVVTYFTKNPVKRQAPIQY